MNRFTRLILVPPSLLKISGRALGRTSESGRICGSLQVDISKTEQLLNWKRPVSLEMGLEKIVAWFLDNV